MMEKYVIFMWASKSKRIIRGQSLLKLMMRYFQWFLQCKKIDDVKESTKTVSVPKFRKDYFNLINNTKS